MRCIVSTAIALLILGVFAPAVSADGCRTGAFVISDTKDILAIRGAVERACPCATYDGSSGLGHGDYKSCAKAVIDDAIDGTPVLGAFSLRPECRTTVRRIVGTSTCGYATAQNRVVCCQITPAGKASGKIKRLDKCVTSPSGVVRSACLTSAFTDVCTSDPTSLCRTRVVQQTVNLPSAAQGAHTPGTPAVVVTNPKLLTQFGGPSFSLNNARYTRFGASRVRERRPTPSWCSCPGFEGGAGDFEILAENLIVRAIHRRTGWSRGLGLRPSHRTSSRTRSARTSPRRSGDAASRSTGSSAASSA